MMRARLPSWHVGLLLSVSSSPQEWLLRDLALWYINTFTGLYSCGKSSFYNNCRTRQRTKASQLHFDQMLGFLSPTIHCLGDSITSPLEKSSFHCPISSPSCCPCYLLTVSSCCLPCVSSWNPTSDDLIQNLAEG